MAHLAQPHVIAKAFDEERRQSRSTPSSQDWEQFQRNNECNYDCTNCPMRQVHCLEY